MRLSVRPSLLVVSVALLAACGGSTDNPVATTVSVSPGVNLSLTSINQTSLLKAAVLNQHGDTMAGQPITWSSNNAAVATVNAGLVTAKSNGSAVVTATSGSIHTDVAVTVQQVPAVITKASGDAQSGTVGAQLPTALTIVVVDALGSVVPNQQITFAVTSGGGSVGTPSSQTSNVGVATTTWTLGTNSTLAQVVTVTAGAAQNSFTATAQAGPVSAVVVNAGNNQTAATGTAVATRPSVKVTDSFGNPKPGVTVNFAVASGGGSTSAPASPVADANGIATVGGWTMGASAGANTLSATASGTAISFTFTATAVSAGAPTTIASLVGNGQTALVGFKTNVRPAVKVTDSQGFPVSGVSVTFAVTGGGGSATSTTVSTNANGIAQVGSWTVGVAAGSNTMTATSGSLAGSPVTFTVTGATQGYDIVIQNTGPAFSPAVQAAFDSAVAFWRRAIFQTVGSSTVNAPAYPTAGSCGTGSPAVNATIKDLRIMARVDTIDGPGKILGQAGPCYLHGTSHLTVLGTMTFDSADLSTLATNGSLRYVIQHEMGHVLGFGVLFGSSTKYPGAFAAPYFDCEQNPSSGGNPLDTYFSCAGAQAQFDSIGGVTYTGGQKVPMENCGAGAPAGCGSGTFNSHWREAVFGDELMTGYINCPSLPAACPLNPLSSLSIAALGDIGYTVNYAAADAYVHTFTVPGMLAAMRAGSNIIGLDDDVYRGPIRVAIPVSGPARTNR